MRASAPPSPSLGLLGRGLVVMGALLLVLVAAPCAAVADGDAGCGHCAVGTQQHDGHQGDCFHCDTEAVAAPAKADDRSPGGTQAADVPAAPVLVAARPALPALRASPPRPPDVRLYLQTRRLRL